MKLLYHKQYVIYDFNSFMADWGGYMGLVLGYREILDSVIKAKFEYKMEFYRVVHLLG